MRIIIVVVAFVLCMCSNAASARWGGINISNNESFLHNYMCYWLGGGVYGENGEYGRIHTSIYGHIETGGLHLKQFDFSGEMMEPTFCWWALALYGDIVSETTFSSLNQIELFSGTEPEDIGGTLVENPEDFYMAFKVSEVLKGSTGYEEGMSWYGWVHVTVDENLEMTLLGADINLYGGAVMVGAIPEPSGGILLLIGAAVLGLRRVEKLES